MIGLTGYLLTAAAAIAALIGIVMKSRIDGARLEHAKRAAEDLRAAEDRLEMDREATAEGRKAADMSDAEARREALKWARH
jgi:outer membrane murein-binding lipoprotein Lpp